MSVYEEVKFGVHIIGPDTIVAAKDFKEAADNAAEINASYYGTRTPYSPLIYANVIEWNSRKYGEHDPDATDWSDLG